MGAYGYFYTLPVARVHGVSAITSLGKLVFIYVTFPPLFSAAAAAAAALLVVVGGDNDATATFTFYTSFLKSIEISTGAISRWFAS